MADTIKITRCDHGVADTGSPFTISPFTRTISHPSPKSLVLIQGDANSEAYTIQIPYQIDNHRVEKCSSIQIHYINAGSEGETLEDIYEIAELKEYPDDDVYRYAEWILSGNAAMYNGTLAFAIKFMCTGDEGEILYSWSTLPFTGISVGKTITNTESVYYQYSDIIAQWYNKLMSAETMVTDVDNRIKELEEQLDEAEIQIMQYKERFACISELPNSLWMRDTISGDWCRVYIEGGTIQIAPDNSGPNMN